MARSGDRATTPGRRPCHNSGIGRGDKDNRRYRGGSFDNYPRHHDSACRISDKPSYDFAYVGMRIVCTVEMNP